MIAVSAMRGFVNSMHVMHAVNCGVELGLFQSLADCPPPVPVDEYVDSVPYEARYVEPWLHSVQSAGIINLDDDGRLTFADDWQEALTDPNSSNYLPPMLKCHMAIEKTYPQFPAIFRGKASLPLTAHDDELVSSVAADGVRFANFFLQEAIAKIPGLSERLIDGISVYDVGCGGGQFLLKVAAAYPNSRYVGVDQLSRAIALAGSSAATSALKDIVTFKKMCATKLDSGVADFVILNEVLHEMDPSKRLDALKACRRALKKDGILFIVDILSPERDADYSQPGYQLSALVEFFEAPWGSKLMKQSELLSMMKLAGFGELNNIVAADNVVAAYTKPA